MFKRIVASLILSATFSLPAFAHSDHGAQCAHAPLGKIMADMKKDLKTYIEGFKAGDQALMQAQLVKLLNDTRKSKEEIPLRLQEMDHQLMPNMDHGQLGHPGDGVDHSKMGENAGMSKTAHRKHKEYIAGMGRLEKYLKALQVTEDSGEIKGLLAKIKKHSRRSHKAFRKECEGAEE